MGKAAIDCFSEVTSGINSVSGVIPAQRALHKKGFSFSNKPFDQQLPIWDHIWNESGTYKAMLHAYLFIEKHLSKKDLHDTLWKTSRTWQDKITDWGLCDALAKINSRILVTYPDKVYRQLAIWNKSTDLWKRRQSVVSMLYFSRTKKIYLPFEKIAALVTPLLHDEEYYVQKGVGWTLREMHTVYPEATLPYLQKHINDISAIAFTIAIEKMNDAEKKSLKLIRTGRKQAKKAAYSS